MRLDAQPPLPRDRLAPAERRARGPTALPPFFAGMTPAARTSLDEALGEPGGLILVAGPRGSGRATTLRCLLKARPDALALGDIGGSDRARAAFQAARGRLILATIEAGDSIAAVSRIVRLGVEPFSIACVLRLVLTQRLARRLCPSCRTPVQPPASITAPLGLEPGAVAYRPLGCGTCDGTGFAGPIGAFEALPVDPNVGRLIVCGAEQAAIANHVFRTWPNLAAAVRSLVIHGHSSAEEAIALMRPGPQPHPGEGRPSRQ